MVIDRIFQILEYKGISKNRFYKDTGLSNGFLDKVKDIGVSKIEYILNSYPEINIEWLMTGKGPMLKESNSDNSHLEQENWIVNRPISPYESGKHSYSSLLRVGLRIDEITGILNISHEDFAKSINYDYLSLMEIISGKKPAPSELLDKIANRYPQIDKLWLYTGNGKPVTELKPIPLIPLEAVAGFGNGHTDQIMLYDTEKYIIPEFRDLEIEFLIRMKGNSMTPKYNSGDILGCKKLPMETFFQWGKVYVLDTVQGSLVKRVFKSDQPGYITCVSDNINYPPFELEFDTQVHAIAIVLGVIGFE